MLKTEAKQIAKDRVEKGNIANWFCPIIKTMCNPHCVCYKKLAIRTYGPNEMAILEGDCCTCHLLIGDDL